MVVEHHSDIPNCPKCRRVVLQPLELPGTAEEALTCRECHGVWLSRETVASGVQLTLPDPDFELSDRNYDRKAGLCPFGHGILIRAKPVIEPACYLDRCPKCGGVWFDHGEWQRLAAAGITLELLDIWTKAWRRKKRREQARREYLNMLKNNLGKAVFQQTRQLARTLARHPFGNQALIFLREEMERLSRAETEKGEEDAGES